VSYDLRSALGRITVIAVVIAVVSYLLSLIVSATLLTTTLLGGQLHVLTQIFPFWVLMLGIAVQTNSLLIVTISLVVYAGCLIKAADANGGFLSSLRLMSSGTVPRTLPNWLVVMPLLASAILVIDLLLTLLQSTVGVSTGSLPVTDPTTLIPLLAFAPVAEEIGFRITVIGLVVGVLVAVKFGRNLAGGARTTITHQVVTFFSAFLSPGYAKERVGLPSIRTSGFRGISIPEWIFLFLTSIIFGAYHILGGGWGPGKFLTAAISGFALGIVYLAYGAFADILLHWFFDLYLTVFAFYDGLNGFFGIFGDLATLGALALGVWGIIVGIYWSINSRSSANRLQTVQFR
jgi:membrane protease YdiL (CAAX protease family)